MIIITSSKENKDSLVDEVELLAKVRRALLNDKTAKKICREKNIGEWFLSGVPIKFEDIKQSAKTVNAHIILNKELAEKPFEILMRYVIHELTHAIQHTQNDNKKNNTDEAEDYLDKDTEVEAFKYQIEFDSKKRGDSKAEEYVDDLLDFHNLRGQDRDEKKRELLA